MDIVEDDGVDLMQINTDNNNSLIAKRVVGQYLDEMIKSTMMSLQSIPVSEFKFLSIVIKKKYSCI